MQDVSKLNKDDLQAYAQSGADFPATALDLKKSISVLREQVESLQGINTQANAIEEDVPPKPIGGYVKNIKTGLIFVATAQIIAHLKDEGVLCDSEGNPV